MARKPWRYRRDSKHFAGIWCDDGTPHGRYLWMKLPGGFQVGLAKLICSELNRAGVRVSSDGHRFEVTERNGQFCAVKAKGPQA